jgi:dTDP-4-amino-4,6-dideoxygalactose transaminase
MEPALTAARAVAVLDADSAELLSAYHPALSNRVTAVPALSLESRPLQALLESLETVRDVPWTRGPEKPLAVSRPVMAGPELRYIEEVLRSGWWGYGPVARHLESSFAAFCGGGVEVLAVSSCTAALHLALLAVGVGPGDEVIVPALTFVATAAAVAQTGATPRFADVDPETLCLAPESVEKELSSRTRAIVPVDFAGLPADLPALEQLAAGRGIALIEDAAHAMGSTRDGRRIGSLAPFTCFSFAPTKQNPSCSGGLLVYQDASLGTMLRELSNVGLRVDTRQRSDIRSAGPMNEVVRVGYRYRMDDVSAAMAVAQVEALAATISRRGRLVERYRLHLAEIPGCEPITVPPAIEPSWYILPVRVRVAQRDPLREHLAGLGIDSSVHYPSLLEQPAFSGCPGSAPVAARESRRLVSLPLSTAMTCADVDRVCEAVGGFLTR